MTVDIDKQALIEIVRQEVREGLKPALKLAALREKILLTSGEVEALYSIKSNQLKTLRAQGKGPACHRYDRRAYYTHSDIMEFIRREGQN